MTEYERGWLAAAAEIARRIDDQAANDRRYTGPAAAHSRHLDAEIAREVGQEARSR